VAVTAGHSPPLWPGSRALGLSRYVPAGDSMDAKVAQLAANSPPTSLPPAADGWRVLVSWLKNGADAAE
jgi:hypothetical protein